MILNARYVRVYCRLSESGLTYPWQVWDVTRGEKVGSLVGHENRVSCLGVSNDGISLCTGSWDSLVSLPLDPNGLDRRSHQVWICTNTSTAQNLGILEPANPMTT